MNKKYIYLLVFLIFTVSVSAQNYTTNGDFLCYKDNSTSTQYCHRNISINDLPLNGDITFNIPFIQNYTVNFTDMYNNAKTYLYYPDSHYYLQNETYPFQINYSILFFANYTGNSSKLIDVIGISNDYNSNVNFINLRFNINHPENLTINKTNTSSYLYFSEDGKVGYIKTYTSINFLESHPITVKAPNNTTINFDCGQFMDCPENLTITKDNELKYDVPIFIPKHTTAGNYHSYINISTTNSTTNKTGGVEFEIEVIYSDDFSQTFEYMLWDESCFENETALAKCYQQQATRSQEMYNIMMEKIKKQEPNETIIYNETIKYVEVGNVDKMILDDYNNLRGDHNELADSLDKCRMKLDSNFEKLEKCTTESDEENKKLVNQLAVMNTNLKNATMTCHNNIIDDRRSVFSWIFGIACILCFLSLPIGVYLYNSYKIEYFPYKIMLIITGALLICFIIIQWLVR